MSKLATKDKFFDLSDYGRGIATTIAKLLKNTKFTPIHVTMLFGVAGLTAIYCMVQQQYFLAGCFLILKSIIDAADGELARIKNTPSYTGRYLDSIFDIVLNFLFLITICRCSNSSFFSGIIAFICIQLQGTLYNYYYVILRNKSVGGDATSKIFENSSPIAFPQERQRSVDILFKFYSMAYGFFDKTIHYLDKDACKVKSFPNWFMTLLSIYGLGFQLLIMAVLLTLNLINFIIPFFIGYSLLMIVIIGIRKTFKSKFPIDKIDLKENKKPIKALSIGHKKMKSMQETP